MQEFIKFAILGLGVGALYALASQGLMVIYRGSGVLNFGHGAVGMVGAYFSWELREKQDWPFILALLFGVGLSALIGALTHLLVMRQLRKASPLARIVATLGVLIILQSAAVVRYGGRVTFVKTELPDNLYEVGGITIALDRIILVVIATVLTIVLWAFYKFTNFGLATSGVAENQRAAAAIGLSPDKVATINWAIGSALAGLAAILVSPIVTLQVTTMTNLVLAALAAALVAGFRSFPIALVAGLLIGVGQTELVNYVSTPGISQSFPFLVIIAVMVLRGTALPVRGYFLQRLPAVGDGKVKATHIAIGVVIALILITQLPTLWQDSMVTTFAMATILLSIVVVTGYAGQLSLGQYALAGLGGILISFRKDTILFSSEFNNFISVTSVGWAFLGGIGWLMGPIFGATLTPGSIGARISNSIFSGIEQYVQLIGGVFVVLIVLLNQDGIAKESAMQVKWIGSKLKGLVKKPDPDAVPVVEKMELPPETRDRVAPVTLKVDGLTVRYGGVTAVEDVTLQVPPGKITGLIGPNGAGKTSFIDAVTGFTRAAAGSITLDDMDVTKLNAPKRARQGMSRSFQSLELFEDLSVLDNLRAASDPRDQKSYLTDLFWPVNPPLPGSVVAAINEFGLEDDLLRKVEDLSYGNRRLLAIARAVATQPNVLLLDEPAAGLGDAETAELATLVRRLADEWGMSILLVEHDMNFVMSVCDNIVVLDFGRKIAEGTPAEIQSNPLVVAAYLGGEHADH